MGHERLKVGVIGLGLVAQVMHLPYLTELDDLFEVRALCDSSRKLVERCGKRFGVTRLFTDWQQILGEDLDAVLVLTSGSHAQIAVAAADAGMHVFAEKPMCYSVNEGVEMLEAAESAGTVLMVGYPKRYDPAYQRVRDEVRRLEDLRFVRLTTLESPFQPYIAHYPLFRGDDIEPGQLRQWRADSDQRVEAAIGPASALGRHTYELVLLDSVVHEFNLLRGILGEPAAVKYVSMREGALTVVLDFDGIEAIVAWLDLPGIASYEMEACFYSPRERVRLSFPSPFLRSEPTLVEIQTGEAGGPALATSRETVSYEEPFKLELVEFHRAVTQRAQPLSSGLDALKDMSLCQSVIASALSGRPVPNPTDIDRILAAGRETR